MFAQRLSPAAAQDPLDPVDTNVIPDDRKTSLLWEDNEQLPHQDKKQRAIAAGCIQGNRPKGSALTDHEGKRNLLSKERVLIDSNSFATLKLE